MRSFRMGHCLAAVGFYLTCMHSTGWAFEYEGVKWARHEMPVGYRVNHQLTGDISDERALAGVQAGYDAWNQLDCSYMRWSYDGRTANTGWGSADGVNVVTWRNGNWDDSSGAIAITAVMSDGGGNFIDADIKFNGTHFGWANFDRDPGGADGRMDVAHIATHEVGHALGLDHSNVAGATMWPSAEPGDIGSRSLSRDDIEGACWIYPSGGEVPDAGDDRPPPPNNGGGGGLGSDCRASACADGLFCIDDGSGIYCSQSCRPDRADCPADYACAGIEGGGGACVHSADGRAQPDPGDAPGDVDEPSGFGADCAPDYTCNAGLICIDDGTAIYCSQYCRAGECPAGYACAGLEQGNGACVRSDEPDGGPAPDDSGGPSDSGGFGGPSGGHGESCGDNWACDANLACIDDGSSIYCSRNCRGVACPGGYFCAAFEDGEHYCVEGEEPASSGDPPPREDRPPPVPNSDVGDGGQADEGENAGPEPPARVGGDGEAPQPPAAGGGGGTPAPPGQSDGADAPLPPQVGEQSGPGMGEPCGSGYLCGEPYFCISDDRNIDPATGQSMPYCTTDCTHSPCEAGYACVRLEPSGNACQMAPAGAKPSQPFANPNPPPPATGADEVGDPQRATGACNVTPGKPSGGSLVLLLLVGMWWRRRKPDGSPESLTPGRGSQTASRPGEDAQGIVNVY